MWLCFHLHAASGAQITIPLVHDLHRYGGKCGLGEACTAREQGVSILLEAFK